MASDSLHEDPEVLGPEVIDTHRAIVSIMEELEAVDWYNQRAAATGDEELRAILTHNRDEEKEHASMVLEWLRRRDPALDKHLKTYLFSDGPIHETAEAAEGGGAEAAGDEGGRKKSDGSLGIGSLKRKGTTK